MKIDFCLAEIIPQLSVFRNNHQIFIFTGFHRFSKNILDMVLRYLRKFFNTFSTLEDIRGAVCLVPISELA